VTGATAEGTAAFAAEALKAGAVADHFRDVRGWKLSTIGLGTYLGEADDETDALYERAVGAAAALGCNFVDTAINYRHQRSERAVGRALGRLARDRVVIATKGGYLPLDAGVPDDPRGYVRETYFETGLLGPDDVAGGVHAMAPAFLRDQIRRSLENLGLQTLDVYYLHNPEHQLAVRERADFRALVRSVFEMFEEEVAEGRLAAYGVATWNGLRVAPSHRDFLALEELERLAKDVAGREHHFAFVQAPYNIAMTEVFAEANQPLEGEAVSLARAAESLGVALVASASIGQGQLASGLPDWLGKLLKGLVTDAQLALQFVRSTPGVASALVGMKTPEHIRENLAAARVAPAPLDDFMSLFEVDSGSTDG
jgi:aryl-alcohol dehydrogenase-like predicted oxidoreductase